MPDENKVITKPNKKTRTATKHSDCWQWRLPNHAKSTLITFKPDSFEISSHAGAKWELSYLYKADFVEVELTLVSAKKTITNFSGEISLLCEEKNLLEFPFSPKSLAVKEKLRFESDIENLNSPNLELKVELWDYKIEYWRDLSNGIHKDNLRNLLFNEKDSDVTLVAKDGEIPAHKVLISSQSEVFNTMFSSEMQEKQKSRVEIKDIDVNALKEMLRFAYIGQVDDMENHAADLMIVATKYKILHLRIMCKQFLIDNLSTENAAKLIILAISLKDAHMVDTVMNFIRPIHHELMETPDWKLIKENDFYLKSYIKLLAPPETRHEKKSNAPNSPKNQ